MSSNNITIPRVPKRLQYFIDEAVKEAKKSIMHHKHGAVLIKNGEIIGRGFNYTYTHLIHNHWSMHAERAVIFDCLWRKLDISGSTLVVIRLSRRGILLNSCPCIGCGKQILKAGISTIFYSINEEETLRIDTQIISNNNMDILEYKPPR